MALSACVFRRRLARSVKSDSLTFILRQKSFIKKFISISSKSEPPKCVLPDVAFTSNTPSSIVSIETSNVPPPRSYTTTFCSFSVPLSKPYARAAAVGSLIIRRTFRPAIIPASLVACRCSSLKYAGTVTTAFLTSPPK